VPRYRSNPVAAPEFKTKSQEPRDWIEPVAGGSLEFRTTGQARDVAMVPFYKILDERYAVYWKVTQAK
jgi:hypothetical protein